MMRKAQLLGAFSVILGAAIVGCGGGVETPETVPVSGTVMYNGNPVPGATVSFMSDAAPRAATGITDSEGKFQLSTFGANDGAIPGEHKVTVTKIEGEQAASTSPNTAMMNDPSAMANAYQQQAQGAGAQGPKSALPEKYASLSSTPLTETVKEGQGPIVLHLKD